MKQAEILNWAMLGVIAEKMNEPDEQRAAELEEKLKELSLLLLLDIVKK